MNKQDLNTRIIAIKIIQEVLIHNRPLKATNVKYLKNTDLSNLDINFITELVKGTIRMYKRLSHEASCYYHGKFHKLEKLYVIILNLAVYQIRYMSNVPDYAIVSTSVEITKKFFTKYSKITNGLLRNMISDETCLRKPNKNDSTDYISIYYSHPKWLVGKWHKKYDFNSLIKLLEYNNDKPQIWFRHSMNIKNLSIYSENKKIDLTIHPYLNNFFTVKKTSSLINHESISKGNISVQSPTNGLIVKLLNPKSSDTIIDLCAAPGGKTIAISDYMLNSGKIYAYDIDAKRIEVIKENIKKNKISNIKVELKDSSKDKIHKASKMIADVPCLGTGTICKNADLRWKKNLNDLHKLINLQESILNNSSRYLKPNGIIVYSTCSIEEEENWMVIDRFLEKHPNYIVDNANRYVDSIYTDARGAINITPQIHGIDGGFAVRLINYES